MVVHDPALVTLVDVVKRARGLLSEFTAFRMGAELQSHLIPTLYPGDRITLDSGAEPLEADRLYEIVSMTTTAGPLSLPVARRYRTRYQCREIV